jgi:hypothetical protein
VTKTVRPGAHHSDRAGEVVLAGTLPLTTAIQVLQLHRVTPLRLVSWRVNRWLGVETVEVTNG